MVVIGLGKNLLFKSVLAHCEQVIPICMQLCSVEHKLNTSLTFLLSKLDPPVIKTLDRIRFTSNQNIGEGESNFDEKNVEEMLNRSEVHLEKKYYL